MLLHSVLHCIARGVMLWIRCPPQFWFRTMAKRFLAGGGMEAARHLYRNSSSPLQFRRDLAFQWTVNLLSGLSEPLLLIPRYIFSDYISYV
jgi:hypothetical protein